MGQALSWVSFFLGYAAERVDRVDPAVHFPPESSHLFRPSRRARASRERRSHPVASQGASWTSSHLGVWADSTRASKKTPPSNPSPSSNPPTPSSPPVSSPPAPSTKESPILPVTRSFLGLSRDKGVWEYVSVRQRPRKLRRPHSQRLPGSIPNRGSPENLISVYMIVSIRPFMRWLLIFPGLMRQDLVSRCPALNGQVLAWLSFASLALYATDAHKMISCFLLFWALTRNAFCCSGYSISTCGSVIKYYQHDCEKRRSLHGFGFWDLFFLLPHSFIFQLARYWKNLGWLFLSCYGLYL